VKPLILKTALSITSEDVIYMLKELFAMRGLPQNIRSDNAPGFIAKDRLYWLTQVGVEASQKPEWIIAF